MSALHERLVAELGDRFDNYRVEVDRRGAALRAVVELHAPQPCPQPCSVRHEHLTCRICGGEQPCEEIRTIAEHLGISIEGEGHHHGDR